MADQSSLIPQQHPVRGGTVTVNRAPVVTITPERVFTGPYNQGPTPIQGTAHTIPIQVGDHLNFKVILAERLYHSVVTDPDVWFGSDRPVNKPQAGLGTKSPDQRQGRGRPARIAVRLRVGRDF